MSRRRLLVTGTAMAGLLVLVRRISGAAGAEAAHFSVTHSDAEWRNLLTPAQYTILRHEGTEPPGASPLDAENRTGTYACVGCDQALFGSATKFHSGTGWPSFWQPLPGGVGTRVDRALFIPRTEVHCANCGGHLGHVFDDGPKPTGLRYCMNGTVLSFHAA